VSDEDKRLEEMARELYGFLTSAPDSGACIHRPNGGICLGCQRQSAKERILESLRQVQREERERWRDSLFPNNSDTDLGRGVAAEARLREHLALHKTADSHDCAEMEEEYQRVKAETVTLRAEVERLKIQRDAALVHGPEDMVRALEEAEAALREIATRAHRFQVKGPDDLRFLELERLAQSALHDTAPAEPPREEK
jgi:hypothetical protein